MIPTVFRRGAARPAQPAPGLASGERSRRLYDRWHAVYGVDGGTAPWHKLLLSHLDPVRDLASKAVLEIGCGRGGLACALARHPQRPARLVAADFSFTAVGKGKAFAAEHEAEDIQWEVADIQNIAHADASFDTVISCETIEHVPDPGLALIELARVLRPGGRLLLTTPNYLGWWGLYRAYRRVIGRRFTEEGQPINNFMILPRTLAHVRRAGLRVITCDAVGHYLYRPKRPPRELIALEKVRSLRWFAFHSLVVAEKP